MGYLYLSLDKKYLADHSKEMSEEATSMDGETSKLLYNVDDANIKIDEIDEETNEINVVCETEIGYLSIAVPMNANDLINLIELATKKLNKVKAILEASK